MAAVVIVIAVVVVVIVVVVCALVLIGLLFSNTETQREISMTVVQRTKNCKLPAYLSHALFHTHAHILTLSLHTHTIHTHTQHTRTHGNKFAQPSLEAKARMRAFLLKC